MPPQRNYKFEKRQKDLAKNKKKEEKLQRKLLKKDSPDDEFNAADAEGTQDFANDVTDGVTGSVVAGGVEPADSADDASPQSSAPSDV